jgi:hypothetical protein
LANDRGEVASELLVCRDAVGTQGGLASTFFNIEVVKCARMTLRHLGVRFPAIIAATKAKNTPADTAAAALSIAVRRNLAVNGPLAYVSMKKGEAG